MNQDLLYKYFKGNANIEEEKQILDWVDASDENRKAFQKERMLYDIALFSEEKQSERLKRKTRILPMDSPYCRSNDNLIRQRPSVQRLPV